MKLKTKDIAQYRGQQLTQQNNRCALCEDPVAPEEAVLDHCHKTGLLRKVLHRGCNSFLGRIENGMPRSRVTIERLRVISTNLVKYITEQHTVLLHPTHKTLEEKKLSLKKRRLKNKRSKPGV